MDAGASAPLGPRWFRSAGGMPPTHLTHWAKPPSRRYLSFAEREDIALELVRGPLEQCLQGRIAFDLAFNVSDGAVQIGGQFALHFASPLELFGQN